MERIQRIFKSRRAAQLLSTLLMNANLMGFTGGTIYTGSLKVACVPGLNCYSCPGAVGACPIGALQNVLGSRKFNFSFYVVGTLMLFGTLMGRFVCGFLCPFGLIQDLLYKIRTPKPEIPRPIDRPLRYLKYAVLLVPVILLPALLVNPFGVGAPYFCKWICPAGTLEGGIPLLAQNEGLRRMVGPLFDWKLLLLVLTVLGSVFLYRPFCKYLCPLGAVYALFNRISAVEMRVDGGKCTGCGACERACKMSVAVTRNINSPECIRCGECRAACATGAISTGLRSVRGQGRQTDRPIGMGEFDAD